MSKIESLRQDHIDQLESENNYLRNLVYDIAIYENEECEDDCEEECDCEDDCDEECDCEDDCDEKVEVQEVELPEKDKSV